MQCISIWVIPRHLSSKSRCFGTLYRFHLQGQVEEEWLGIGRAVYLYPKWLWQGSGRANREEGDWTGRMDAQQVLEGGGGINECCVIPPAQHLFIRPPPSTTCCVSIRPVWSLSSLLALPLPCHNHFWYKYTTHLSPSHSSSTCPWRWTR